MESASLSEVKGAIQKASDSRDALERSLQQYVSWLELQDQARQALKNAVLSSDSPKITMLQDALSSARTAGLSQEEMQPAKAALECEEQRGKARDALKAALSVEEPTVSSLRGALELAEAAKLPRPEISEMELAYEALALAESREKAREMFDAVPSARKP